MGPGLDSNLGNLKSITPSKGGKNNPYQGPTDLRITNTSIPLHRAINIYIYICICNIYIYIYIFHLPLCKEIGVLVILKFVGP